MIRNTVVLARERGDCWNRIGVTGDGTCVELKQHIHCRNCPVFVGAGRGLLERAASDEYVTQWTLILSKEKAVRPPASDAHVVFRVAGEHLALPAPIFRDVRVAGRIHRLPHRSNEVLLGVASVGGEIRPCLSIERLLGIDRLPDGSSGAGGRWIVVGSEAPWVLVVDEVLAIHRTAHDEVKDAPSTAARAAGGFARGVFPWRDIEVAILDANRLLRDLDRWLE